MTLVATRGIASALRNRAGNYLLVLTHDYERIDFVLVAGCLVRFWPGRFLTNAMRLPYVLGDART